VLVVVSAVLVVIVVRPLMVVVVRVVPGHAAAHLLVRAVAVVAGIRQARPGTADGTATRVAPLRARDRAFGVVVAAVVDAAPDVGTSVLVPVPRGGIRDERQDRRAVGPADPECLAARIDAEELVAFARCRAELEAPLSARVGGQRTDRDVTDGHVVGDPRRQPPDADEELALETTVHVVDLDARDAGGRASVGRYEPAHERLRRRVTRQRWDDQRPHERQQRTRTLQALHDVFGTSTSERSADALSPLRADREEGN